MALLTTALMYMQVIPIGLFFAWIGLILYYWTLKYKLLKHHKIPEQLNENVII